MLVGADSGGTFTDVVDERGHVAKVLSTPDDPARALAGGVRLLAGDGRPALLAHGTTVATNALLERRGGRVALVTTRGFADVIEIARQVRPSLYDIFRDRPVPLVPRDARFEVAGRLGPDGAEIEPVGAVELAAGFDAVAVCLLHADRSPAHENAVGAHLAAGGHDVVLSSRVSPEFREYERTVTTVVNAYLRAVCSSYLVRIDDLADEVLVMTSAGGLVPASDAAEVPAALLLSGPAGGVRAGAEIAAACGFADAVTFDMGGTSTDVCLVRGGVPEPAPQRIVAGLPVRLPSLDIHTIGAGGGSIARLDAGGALVVGPESAGAAPGPACYGRGGTDPTVTDADLLLGRIPADAVFGDLGRLDTEAAQIAIEKAGVTPEGIVAVVDTAMEGAIRAVTVERGIDPRTVALVAFGGAGPLHACALADALGMPAVIVPPRAGVLSAVGLLGSPRQRELVRSAPTDVDALVAAARAAVGGGDDITFDVAYDCRYAGQSHELTVAPVDAFHAEHARRNGYARPDATVEVVAVRVRATRPAPLDLTRLPPVSRTEVRGPRMVAEDDCTVWVPDGWTAELGNLGAWVIHR
jgi:N-methylhydantoinase A/oxoprolinase/acetone carboxylase beta subunit